MDLEINGDEFTVKGMIQLNLLSIQVVIDTLSEDGVAPDSLFVTLRNNLVSLLDRLDAGRITREYAEIELEKIQELLDQWQKDNAIPPD